MVAPTVNPAAATPDAAAAATANGSAPAASGLFSDRDPAAVEAALKIQRNRCERRAGLI